MKLIHCAESFSDSAEEKNQKETERRKKSSVRLAAFLRVVKVALSSGIPLILVTGDLFCPEEMNQELKEVFRTCMEKNPELELMVFGSPERTGALKELLFYELPNVRLMENGSLYRQEEQLVLVGVTRPEELPALSETDVNLVVTPEVVSEELWRGKRIDYLGTGGASYKETSLESRGCIVSPGSLAGREQPSDQRGFVELEVSLGVLRHRHISFSPETNMPLISREDYRYDISLRGEFTRLVMESDLSGEDKQTVLGMGVRALTGAEP